MMVLLVLQIYIEVFIRLVSHRVGIGVLGTRGTKERFNLLRKFLVSTFDVIAHEVLGRHGSSPQQVTR